MRRITSLALASAFVVCLSLLSMASTVQVGGCLAGVVNFTTIQSAINAVPPGSTIKVCPGGYYEQLLITKRLTLTGIANAGADAAIIYPPAGGLVQNTTDARGAVAAQILVQRPLTATIPIGAVSISNLTVDGIGNNYNTDDLRGILYQDAGGTVNHVAVRNELPGDALTGLQSGQGIMVETTNFSDPVTLAVQNSSVHNYNKNGILARYAGATLNATGNYVQGYGPTPLIAQNGIELAFNGAAGSIKSNTVIDNYYTGSDATASDILLYDASNGAASVSGNIVGNSNIGIAVVTSTPGVYGDGASVTLNKIMGSSLYDGIDVCTNGNSVTSNTIFNSTESGVHLDASCGGTGNSNTVSGNTILESNCAGILQDTGTSDSNFNNTFYTVPAQVASSCPAPSGSAARLKTHNKFRP